MKLKAIALALVCAGSSTVALADKPGADWMPEDQVKQKVIQAGYTSVTKLEADDGRWEGEGMKNGKRMEFHADPKTGTIINEQEDK